MRSAVKLAVTLISAALTAGAVFAFSYFRGSKDPVSAACDGTFIAAVLFAGAGLLTLIGRDGMFDGLRYIGHLLRNIFVPLGSGRKKQYHEYKESLRKKRAADGADTVRCLLVSGAVMLVLSLVLLAFHYNS
ncbi:MAG: DUF3899 domain-containing protein [Ruminiclostridium sp.]|nr:DUF3899 domain-containing protein [Ruminiclostridium sp.]